MGARFPACIINIVWMAYARAAAVFCLFSLICMRAVCVLCCVCGVRARMTRCAVLQRPGGGVHADAPRTSGDCWLCDMPCIHIIKHLNTVPCAERTYLWIVNIIQIYCCCIISSREIWETAASERPRKHIHTHTHWVAGVSSAASALMWMSKHAKSAYKQTRSSVLMCCCVCLLVCECVCMYRTRRELMSIFARCVQ